MPGQFGATTTSMLIDMARILTLCSHADTFRNQRRIVEIMEEKIPKHRGILILTDKNKLGKEIYHCRVLQGRDLNGQWIVWEPETDGTETDQNPVSAQSLEEEMAHFLVFQ